MKAALTLFNDSQMDPGTIAPKLIESEIIQVKPSVPDDILKDLVSISIAFLNGEASFTDVYKQYEKNGVDTSVPRKLSQIRNTPAAPLPSNTQDNQYKFIPSARKRSLPWTEHEDLRLIAAVLRLGARDWKKIADFVGSGRTSSQCNQRWCRALDPSIIHTPWTKEEDGAKLLNLFQEEPISSAATDTCSLTN